MTRPNRPKPKPKPKQIDPRHEITGGDVWGYTIGAYIWDRQDIKSTRKDGPTISYPSGQEGYALIRNHKELVFVIWANGNMTLYLDGKAQYES